ncbi:MAG: DUF2851 family protein [Bacteroidota bacterium]
MREDLLSYVWQYQKFPATIKTTKGEAIQVVAPGQLNTLEGPDFFNARIGIEGQEWAGNVEIHIKASDWYQHHHESDNKYNNVILHVVWEDDISIFRRDNTEIPTLELKRYVSQDLLDSYQNLIQHTSNRFISCEKDISAFPEIHWKFWEERLYIERLEQKARIIQEHLNQHQNDWERVLFAMLCRSFGTKVNSSFFFERATCLDFSIVRKLRGDSMVLESLFFGHFGLLQKEHCLEPYYLNLKKEYEYQRQKFSLPPSTEVPAFFGMRPRNFPTIRLSQLAQLYHRHENLFQLLMTCNGVVAYQRILKVQTAPFWETHYTFNKVSKKHAKRLSNQFIDLLIINAIVPLKFCYDSHFGKEPSQEIIEALRRLSPEKNTVVENFDSIGLPSKNAFQSQARIQLYKQYCAQKKCLECAVGTHLLNQNP